MSEAKELIEPVVLDIHNVKQFMSVENMGEKLKSMIIDKTIKDLGDKIEITFILDKNKGNTDE